MTWLSTITMNASPVHLDAAASARGVFGGPILLGALTAAIADGLASHVVPSELGIPVGWESIKLLGPVRVHDTMEVETTVLAPVDGKDAEQWRVLTRVFVGSQQLVAELIALYKPVSGGAPRG